MYQVPYYYVAVANPEKILETDFIDDLILMLYDGTATFISDAQRQGLGLNDRYFDLIKKEISKYSERVPMYDIMSNQVYLVYRENVYPRIYYDHYRFIDEDFFQDLSSIKNPSNNERENLRILSYYDLKRLQKTYLKIFYESFVLNNYITTCQRPSFHSGMEHISPYYTTKELYYLAYDWGITNKKILSNEEINRLCKQISQFDISAQTLLEHQIYIYDTKAYGLVKHYSLFGSYYMNIYLRRYRCCLTGQLENPDAIRNKDLENQIRLMIILIKNSPSFIKAHTVYRFIERDDFLHHLKPGDIYQDPSFMSTTRNPFYYQENYSFGYILMKIKLAEDVSGMALCIEAYSNFPLEEEIILPPTTRLRLDRIVEQSTEELELMEKRIKRKYEFTWIGNDYYDKKNKIEISIPGAYDPPIQTVDFGEIIKDENLIYVSVADRIKYFRDRYVNINNQFISTISGHDFVFNLESYDSSTVYKPFFYYEVDDGIMINSANPRYGNINILLELGPEIHVNYYFRFSVSDSSAILDLNKLEWIEWFSLLAYLLGIRKIVIHSNYILKYHQNDPITVKQMKTRYTYSENIYLYLKEKKKMFDNIIGITPNFDYSRLDYLFKVSVDEILKPTDKDELYKIAKNQKVQDIGNFYIYLVEYLPKLLKSLEDKIELIFPPELNPFKNISYTLDSWIYLYNQRIIQQMPSEKESTPRRGSFKKLIGDKKIPKFKNRLRSFLSQ